MGFTSDPMLAMMGLSNNGLLDILSRGKSEVTAKRIIHSSVAKYLVRSAGPGSQVPFWVTPITQMPDHLPQVKVLYSGGGKLIYEFPYQAGVPGKNKARIEIPIPSICGIKAEGDTLTLQLRAPPKTFLGFQGFEKVGFASLHFV